MLFGTSGWSYQEWVGAFYPNDKVSKLPFYSRVFDSVEVDSTFYRIPSKSMAAGWARATGPSFKFSLKMPRTITHDKGLKGAEKETELFFENIAPITKAGKLGCILIQLPPNFMASAMQVLARYLDLLPDKLRFAIEFRHDSWLKKETQDLLSSYNVAQVITDSPLEPFSKPTVTAETHVYIRWHGRGEQIWYDYSYSEGQLFEWKEKIDALEGRVEEVYAYFNNHYRAGAPDGLLKLLAMRGELSESQQKVVSRLERFKKRNTKKLTEYI